MTGAEDIDMMNVTADIAERHVSLKEELRDLAEKWETKGMAADEACAREVRDILEEY